MHNVLLFLLLLPILQTIANNARCSWSRKTVRILVIVEENEQDLITDFQTVGSGEALGGAYDNSDVCIPTIKFSYLMINDSSDEITTIRNTYSSFARNSFCIIILASTSRKICYALEYAKTQQIPVISIVPKVSNNLSNVFSNTCTSQEKINYENLFPMLGFVPIMSPVHLFLNVTGLARLSRLSRHKNQNCRKV